MTTPHTTRNAPATSPENPRETAVAVGAGSAVSAVPAVVFVAAVSRRVAS